MGSKLPALDVDAVADWLRFFVYLPINFFLKLHSLVIYRSYISRSAVQGIVNFTNPRVGELQRAADSLRGKNLLSVDDLNDEQIMCVMSVSSLLKRLTPDSYPKWLKGKILSVLFYEPSTRTRCSFEASALRLGGGVISIADATTSSVKKGESLKDTLETLRGYSEIIVVRQSQKASAGEFVSSSGKKIPIVNAGDGAGEHPTQALLDLFTIDSLFPARITIYKELAREELLAETPLVVTFVGDLKNGRTVHSLAKLLSRYNVNLQFLPFEDLSLPEALYQEISKNAAAMGRESIKPPKILNKLSTALETSDVLYMTRRQHERVEATKEEASGTSEARQYYRIDKAILDKHAKSSLKVLHPLPRLSEIAEDVDGDERAAYFQQAENGVFVRMALLGLLCVDFVDMMPDLADSRELEMVKNLTFSLSEVELVALQKTLIAITDEVLEDVKCLDLSSSSAIDIIAHFKKCVTYNVLGGKLNRGLSVMLTTQALYEDDVLDAKTWKHSAVLCWCVEIMQAFFLVADDVMDNSYTRRGQPCWYRLPDVKVPNAINDSLFLHVLVMKLLARYFQFMPSYNLLIGLFGDIAFNTILGQYLDTNVQPPDATTMDFSRYTEDRYNDTIRLKTAYYSFYLPLALGMTLSGITDGELFKRVKEVSMSLGEYFQIQDDYLDCFGSHEVLGKIGTDIQEAKCSWLLLQALKVCNSEQSQLLKSSYGINDEAKIEAVKDLYRELNMEVVYKNYEEMKKDEILSSIKNVNHADLRELLGNFFQKLYKRTH